MRYSLLALLALAFAPAALADSEIVIAIRYLQAVGVSHSHLYLYREDGTLLRRLTNDNSGQERNPLFSPDGREIVFTRAVAAGDEVWSVEPLGRNLHRVAAAPDWYSAAKDSPYFTDSDDTPGVEPGLPEGEVRHHLAPDKSSELVLRPSPYEDDQVDGKGLGKNYLLRDLRRHQDFVFAKMPGFFGVQDLLHGNLDGSQYYLFAGPLRVTFFWLHLNSTDGDTVFALDLDRHRLVRLSPNWASPVPLPGESAFLTVKEERYVPIPKSEKTANCSVIERWDATLHRVRYARPGTAAIQYGFSMYRPKGKPAVICNIVVPRKE
ncbi:MAG TPA: hypothetical protein VGO11_08315 [Chthoniobacteraceae bacterium]|jgi:hypothetical protein|nr:hypothetical protein [Chthoniobacteraceae bacterium]